MNDLARILGGGPQNLATPKPRDREAAQSRRSPKRAHINYIPEPDALQRLIDRALDALSRGSYWDRGSIINLVL